MKPFMKDNGLSIEIGEILAHYDVGELIAIEHNLRGFCNTSFNIVTERNRKRTNLFLRKYKQSIREEELLFEHSLIDHLALQPALPVARLNRTRDGLTYTQRFGPDDKDAKFFYALFDYRPGEDRYTWVNPHCTQAEIKNIARIFALFHSAVSNFQPNGKRYEPRILELLSNLEDQVELSIGKSKHTAFDDLYRLSQNIIQKNIQDLLSGLQQSDATQMPETVIHCDFHPGNLRFQGDTVSGFFDFDWSKVDYRCFDVGLAIWYFFAEWEHSRDGKLRTEEVDLFLKEYQDTIQQLTGIGPLSPIELKYIPLMVSAGNLYVLNWTILDYYSKEVDPVEYLKYLGHSIHFITRCNERGVQDFVIK